MQAPGLYLTPYMKEMRDKWLAKQYELFRTANGITQEQWDEASEEDMSGAPPYHYEVYPSGIGDNIFVVYNGSRLYLYDDDFAPWRACRWT